MNLVRGQSGFWPSRVRVRAPRALTLKLYAAYFSSPGFLTVVRNSKKELPPSLIL
jgi:hypothetical protein